MTIAILAAVVGSQAVITGTFSMIKQIGYYNRHAGHNSCAGIRAYSLRLASSCSLGPLRMHRTSREEQEQYHVLSSPFLSTHSLILFTIGYNMIGQTQDFLCFCNY
ncbi:hypothetical protein ACJX0J_011714, partial [Zea mays]